VIATPVSVRSVFALSIVNVRLVYAFKGIDGAPKLLLIVAPNAPAKVIVTNPSPDRTPASLDGLNTLASRNPLPPAPPYPVTDGPTTPPAPPPPK
jgi:hypothetical protein